MKPFSIIMHETTLNDLPLDMHLEIMSCLDVQTTGRVAQLNRYWRQLTNPAALVTSSDRARRTRCGLLRRDGRISKLFASLSDRAARHLIGHPGVLYDDITAKLPKPDAPTRLRIAENPNITIEMLLEYTRDIDLTGYQCLLSSNSTITYDELILHGIPIHEGSVCALTYAQFVKLNLQGDLRTAFYRSGRITPEDIIANADEFDGLYIGLLINENIPTVFLLEHFGITVNGKPVNCMFLDQEIIRAMRSPIRVEYQSSLAAQAACNAYLCSRICNNFDIIKSLDREFILNHPDWDWNWTLITMSKKITVWDHLKLSKIPWNWDGIPIAMQMAAYGRPTEINLKYEKMCEDGTITIADIKSKDGWNWIRLATVPSLDIRELLLEYMASKDFNITTNWRFYAALSSREDLTVDIVYEYPQVAWNCNIIIDHIYKKLCNN